MGIFLEKGLWKLFLLGFLRPSHQIINGRPLILSKIVNQMQQMMCKTNTSTNAGRPKATLSFAGENAIKLSTILPLSYQALYQNCLVLCPESHQFVCYIQFAIYSSWYIECEISAFLL